VRSLPPGLTTREMGPLDISASMSLVARCDETYAEWAGEWRQPPEAEELERWERFFTSESPWQWGVFEGERLISTVGWRQAIDENENRIPGVAHVISVFTDPEHWGRGLAGHLLELAETEMRARGFLRARLWTPRDAPARGFYAREGWNLDGRARFEPKFGLDLVGYEKPLGL
jgi:GNAT superfamily N-acetyltransferase